MQFIGMTLWSFAGLAVVTAAVLGGLHYLRIRPKRHRVITTLFWQEAAEKAKARTLFQRFRYPWTYLLLLATSLLLLLALARPVFRLGDQPFRVIILEAGVGMTTPDGRFKHALALVQAETLSSGVDRVAVIAADPEPRLIKSFDESLGVMKSRLRELQPSQELVVREHAKRVATSYLRGRDSGEIVIIAAQPPKEKHPDAKILAAGDVHSNAFILSACFIPALSDPTRGDFRCLVGFSGKKAGSISIQVNGSQVPLLNETVTLEPGAIREFAASVVADGSSLKLTLSGDDAIAGDSNLTFRLPNRRRMVITDEGIAELPTVIQSVVGNLSEASLDPQSSAEASVIRVGSVGAGTEIEIQKSSTGDWAQVTSSEHPLVSGITFEDAVCRIPKEPLSLEGGSVPLMYAGAWPIIAISPDGRTIRVSDVALDPDASLVRRTGYFVLWSNVFRHLARWDRGDVVLSPTAPRTAQDDILKPVKLKSDLSNLAVAPNDPADENSVRSVGWPVLWQVLLGMGIVLMAVEALLNIRGRIA